jgi:hypothetical protein
MDKMNEPFLDSPVACMYSSRESDKFRSDFEVYMPNCPRIARLLRALRELDESIAGFEELREAELSYLVAGAIRESGFVDPIEAWFAIAAILEVIETQAPVTEKSWSC